MSNWNDLSMKEKAAIMKVAVGNGIYKLSDIRKAYNEFAEGGDTNPNTVSATVDAIYESYPKEVSLGTPPHNYDFTYSDKWANEHGYFPDTRGHRDDRVKKPAHPSHPSRGTWEGDRFILTDRGIEDPNYVFFGLNDGEQDPQATLIYKDGVVLPEVTVSPKENYVFNSYDYFKLYPSSSSEVNTYSTANKYAEGGPTDESNNIVDWIIGEEGFNSKPENIGDGKITLGSGLTNSKWHKIYNKKGTWTTEDNRAAVAEEVENRRRWAEQNVPNWSELPEDSQNALLSYKYNYSFTPKNSPKLFQALKDRNYEEAARQMNATSSNPRFRKGLQERRQREQELFMRGINNMNASEPEVAEEAFQENVYTPPQRVLDNIAANNGRYMITGYPPPAGVRNTVLDVLRRLKALHLFVEGGPLVDLANKTL